MTTGLHSVGPRDLPRCYGAALRKSSMAFGWPTAANRIGVALEAPWGHRATVPHEITTRGVKAGA
jgi:hypothetical protein